MNQFDLKIKFEKIGTDLHIPSDKILNFNFYEDYLEKYNLPILTYESSSITLKQMTDSLNKILDLIFLLNYIENNHLMFNYKMSSNETKDIKTNGFNINRFFTVDVNEYFFEKELIVHINKVNRPNLKKKIIRLNFSLLDKKYSLLEYDVKKNNLISIINSIDKYQFTWSNINIHKQVDARDYLFATLNLEIELDNLCENSLNWIRTTSWAPFYLNAQKQLKLFCELNNYKYHFSYKDSVRNINHSLKNINHKINENFLKIYDLYVDFRNCLTKHTSIKYDIESIKANYKDVYLNTFSLLKDKIYCLKNLIYLKKTLIPSLSSEE